MVEKMVDKKNKNFFRKKINSKISFYLVFFLFFISAELIIINYILPKEEHPLEEYNIFYNKNICDFKNKLTGLCVNAEEEENIWPVALMIDNNPDSWPQFGLARADLVYSTLVEGGATRFLAFFTNSSVAKIGPIRSARPYYLTWAKEMNALYGHSGGSVEAIQKIAEYKVLNLEEATSYGPNYFWRDNMGGYYAPHNLFTSSSRLQKAREDFELLNKKLEYSGWFFNTNAKLGNEIADKITINYSSGVLFDVSYEFNTSTVSYLRFQNKAPQIDGLDNSQIAVKNIIIQFVPREKHLDVEDRLYINTIGEGKAHIFYSGHKLEARWKKQDVVSRTKFYTLDGEDVIFIPGNIWVEVVPGNREVMISN